MSDVAHTERKVPWHGQLMTLTGPVEEVVELAGVIKQIEMSRVQAKRVAGNFTLPDGPEVEVSPGKVIVKPPAVKMTGKPRR